MDAVLGPPASGWEGGTRRMDLEGHVATGGDAIRARRHLLLPALWAARSGKAGSLPARSTTSVSASPWRPPRRGASSRSTPCSRSFPRRRRSCTSATTSPAGWRAAASSSPSFGSPAGRLRQAITVSGPLRARARGARAGSRRRNEGLRRRAGAGRDRAAAARQAQASETVRRRGTGRREACPAIGTSTAARIRTGLSVCSPDPGRASRGVATARRVGHVDPGSLEDYRRQGGYAALEKAFALGPEALVREALESKLVGRGGAAFPAGRKWEAVAKQPAQPHYIVCNADESEPGTFKDRGSAATDSFADARSHDDRGVLVGCSPRLLYMRGEYPQAIGRLRGSSMTAYAAGGCWAKTSSGRRKGPRLRHARLTQPGGLRPVARRTALLQGRSRTIVVSPQQAALPRVREGPVRQAHRHQQRRDARLRAADRPRRRRRVCGDQGAGHRRDPSSSVSRATSPGPASTKSNSARPSASSSTRPAECRKAGRSGASSSAARPDFSSGPMLWTPH